ncbi:MULTISPECIES: phage major capsid protein [unclassified Bradyrhizobium]|uniref:phage major capsid protein n=1 Tax=unclassified Bradyrhizobium TaxID=2631580 RepID=UPI001BA9408F|nr:MULTISPECIES: phage major capsid protein [unclassified Bradyrhizobium]WLA52366.1 phage major capsid protein [Bradyrhizobium elkanii]MBR1206968.1 phage major capsid protein [Bradyrhizobium sp. AUGA SZCCT0124]MBR1313507.1 phage major capsid protein [Bradyrhizobium sp. AUGA SZCCT0051]MBR1343396.1 phage major capsid protein [Bradyrhizobium sp. AUGA SZCCT0105]MBR1357184.1 phage major capsid protein [Bradyrhizobium sp. AUGA SZCCT0045]
MSLQQLREQRGAIAAKMRALTDKPTDKWNRDVDGPEWDKLLAELGDVDAAISRINTMNAVTAERLERDAIAGVAERVAHDKKSPAVLLFAKWLRGGDQALTAEDWVTYQKGITNTMSTTTGSQGGYTVQTDVAKVVLDALKAYGGMRAVADVFQTAQGNPLNYPTSDGTNETGEIVGQNTPANGQDITFGTLSLNVYKFSSKSVAVPFELLQDSSVDVEAFVLKRLTTRLGRITNTKFTVGAGDTSNEPNGVITAAPVGVTAANASSQVTAIVYDSLVDLQHSVDPAYRAGGNCKFMMHDLSVKVVRKIKDLQGRPIFVPGYEVGSPKGVPDSILGDPIQVNQDVAPMAASAKSIAYGDFSYYKIRDVMDVTMFRFTDSAYTKLGQVGFLAWMRSGGNLVDVGGAVKTFVNAAT